MSLYVVFGTTADLQDVIVALERTLGASMVLHSSLYWGDYAGWHGDDGEAISVKPNDPGDGELQEPQHPEYPTLVYFDRSDRVRDLVTSLLPLRLEQIRLDRIPPSN